MKYKVGDIVKLKSKEELKKLGTWLNDSVEVCGGKTYKIIRVSGNTYESEDVYFDDNSIECLVEQTKRHTLDELKQKVDEFKDYLSHVCADNDCGINVSFESEITETSLNTIIKKVETRINIFQL